MIQPGIPEHFLKQAVQHALEDYPKECCGVMLGPVQRPLITRLIPCRNVQDDYHVQDPKTFPRTSRNAYWISPEDLLRLQRQMREQRETIKVIYHSHPDAPAYFSEEDKRLAFADGAPVYPEAKYLIISVSGGAPREAAIFAWNETRRDFLLEAKENSF